jgi:indole-3-glycerol phosphate synthase
MAGKLPTEHAEGTEKTATFSFVFRVFRVFRGRSPMDKLAEIIAHKRREIAPLLRPVFPEELAELNQALARPPSFLRALQAPAGQLAVIAEIKRRSPSAGTIKADASALAQALRYQAAGASALSILTDEKYFGGTLADLTEVTAHFAQSAAGPASPPPCLRKDFMVHPVQVLQARLAGASAILIIVRALQEAEIDALQHAATAAGLDALYEIHDETDLQRALQHGAKIIGVNNRDLAVFKTDLALSERLIPRFPPHIIAVSESGIATAADAARVRAAGAHAVLVGEALMRAADPAALINQFRHHE